MLSQFARVRNHQGQAIVEFALVVPILLVLLLGGIDFGRVWQARVTAEASARAGASWGAAHLLNASQPLDPAYAYTVGGCSYGPECNLLYRACNEAAGLPGFSGGATLTGAGAASIKFQDCQTGSAANVCSAGASQSNPYFTVTWRRRDASSGTFTPTATNLPDVGDSIEVDGAYCFTTFFPTFLPFHQIAWTTTSRYVITP